MSSQILALKVHKDHRGSLVAIEGERDLPFPIRRVYYIYGSDGSPRGFHAHRALDQILICVRGSCKIVVDDGQNRADYVLDRPDQALTIGPMTWREMHDISADACILVLASQIHDEADYIRDYDEFRALTGSKG